MFLIKKKNAMNDSPHTEGRTQVAQPSKLNWTVFL